MDEMHAAMIGRVLTVGLYLGFNLPSSFGWEVARSPCGRQRYDKIDTMTTIKPSTNETANFDLTRRQPHQFETSTFPACTMRAEMLCQFEEVFIRLTKDASNLGIISDA